MNMTERCTILSPTAILGYGFPEESFIRGLAMNPDVIAVDGGSTDPGPYYLGAGKAFTNREGVKRDLKFMIAAGIERKIPVIVGTAGGSGAKAHVDWALDIVKELAGELNLSFSVGVIYADIPKELVEKKFKDKKIEALAGVPELTIETIEVSTNIVAQMGYEPMIDALDMGCDVVLAGRAYDPACFAAVPIRMGFDPGLAMHAGKILECAAIASSPGSGSDSVIGIIEDDHFSLMTLSEERRFTKESTCAHTLYEKSDPYHLPGPGGMINLEQVVFTEYPETVEVSGSKFIPSDPYTVKLEAATCVGYRTISIAATHDPIMIGQIDTIIEEVKKRVEKLIPDIFDKVKIHIHEYGKNGVMGPWEPNPTAQGHELVLLIDVLGQNQKTADSVCSLLRSSLLHFGYEGRISTAGNLAFPFSPSDISVGEVYEFSLYHIMELDQSEITSLFPVTEVQI